MQYLLQGEYMFIIKAAPWIRVPGMGKENNCNKYSIKSHSYLDKISCTLSLNLTALVSKYANPVF